MDVFGGVIKLQDNVSGVLKAASKESKSFGSEVKKAKKRLAELEKQKIAAKNLRIKNSEATKAIDEVKKKLKPIKDKAVSLKAKTDVAVSKVKKLGEKISSIKDNKVINFVAKGAGTVAKVATGIVAAGAVAGIAALGAATVYVTKQAINFESQMSNIGTLLEGDVSGKLQGLGKDIKTISKDTGIATSDLTGGLYEVISAFGESGDSAKQLEIAAKAAKAGNSTTTDSVKLLSAVTKGYGDTSAEAVAKVSDLAFETVKLGQTSFPELAASMGAVVPLASTLKVSQEELFGAMSTLTGVTGNTSEVTTQLKATMQGFMTPTKQMSDAISSMGYSSAAAALESEGLGTILNKLKDSVNGDEIAFASMFSSVEAKNAVLALAGSQAENFASKTEAMGKATGSADKAFVKQTSNVKDMAEKIKNRGMVVLMEMGEKALPLLTSALDSFIEHMPLIETTINGMVEGLQPVLEIFANVFTSAFDTITTTLTQNSTTINDVINSFSTIVTTAAPVVGAIFQGIGSVVSAVFPVMGEIIGVISEKIAACMTMLGTHTELFGQIAAVVGPATAEVFSVMGAVIGPIFDLIIAGVDLLLSAFERCFPAIQSVVTSVWNQIKPVFDAIGKGVSTLASGVSAAANFIKGDGGGTIKPGANATGTNYWKGGYTTVGEHGTELINLPAGSKVHSHSETNNILSKKGSVNINISNMTVRQDSDIDEIARKIVEELEKVDR